MPRPLSLDSVQFIAQPNIYGNDPRSSDETQLDWLIWIHVMREPIEPYHDMGLVPETVVRSENMYLFWWVWDRVRMDKWLQEECVTLQDISQNYMVRILAFTCHGVWLVLSRLADY